MSKGRNDQCECGSLLPYKYCCIVKEKKKREITVPLHLYPTLAARIDITGDLMNYAAMEQLPLKNFCKDHEFYFFGVLTVGQCEDLMMSLKKMDLTKKNILDLYKQACKQVVITGLMKDAIEKHEFFKKRELQILKILEIHYQGDYVISIPVLFMVLEGILREVGGLENADSIRPTIPIKIWEQAGLFFAEDDARYFNYFVQKLYEGGKDEEAFNRNPILHGFNVSYYSEEHSLLLILAILEVRLFKFWEQHLNAFPAQIEEVVNEMLANHSCAEGDRFEFRTGFSLENHTGIIIRR